MKTYDFNGFLLKNNIHVFTLDDAARILAKGKHYSAIFLARDKWVKRPLEAFTIPQKQAYMR